MKLHHLLIASLCSLLLAACSSGPPEKRPDATVHKRAAPTKAVERPDTPLAPIDQWDRAFREHLASPWTFDRDAVEIQVEAPENWTRIAGDRGLVLWFTDGTSRHRVWVFPQGFEGKPIDTPPATFFGENGEFVLYTPGVAAPGWSSDEQVLVSLQMHSVQ